MFHNQVFFFKFFHFFLEKSKKASGKIWKKQSFQKNSLEKSLIFLILFRAFTSLCLCYFEHSLFPLFFPPAPTEIRNQIVAHFEASGTRCYIVRPGLSSGLGAIDLTQCGWTSGRPSEVLGGHTLLPCISEHLQL